jgi:hypothetical protein
MTLIKHSTPEQVKELYKIGEVRFDLDKEKFYCEIGTPNKEGDGYNIVHTIWSEDTFEEIAASEINGITFKDYPIRLKMLYKIGYESCQLLAKNFCETEFNPSKIRLAMKNIEAKRRYWLKKLFSKPNYGQ